MLTYYAIFYKLDDGGWGVRFPDAPSIHTGGKDLDEALLMAVDALSGILVIGAKGRSALSMQHQALAIPEDLI